jgi:putative transposase
MLSMPRKTFKYRLRPTKRQEHLLQQVLDACRFVYNETLAQRKQAWEDRQASLPLYTTNKLLTQWKHAHAWLTQAHSQVLQNAQERVDLAFQAFLRRVKAGEEPGYPRFRGTHRYDSFTFKQFGFALQDGRLKLSKIGSVKLTVHRPISGTIKTLTIRRTATDKWFACFSVEVQPVPLPMSAKATGIDVGLEHFATLANGQHIPNPRFFRTDEKALAKAQRRLSKAEHGTPDRAKWRKVVARIHERIANRRRDFCHQESRKLVNTYGTLAFEGLQIRTLLRNGPLTKSIADAAWGQFVHITTYKAEEAGRCVVQIDPRHTSQLCSRCGQQVQKSLSTRFHQCPSCGLRLQRDHNAAINILRLGLESLGLAPRSSVL